MPFCVRFLVLLPFVASGAVAQSPEASGDRLREARIGYTVVMAFGEQSQTFEGVRVVERGEHAGQAVWRTVDSYDVSEGADTTEVDALTLLPIRRAATGQGLAYTFDDGRASGTVAYGGETRAFDVDLGGTPTASEAALELLVAGLDLAPGTTDTLHVFDPYAQGVRTMTMAVVESDGVTTPAGTFETFRLTIVPVDGDGLEQTTFDVLQEAPHYVVRAHYQLPRVANSGTFDIEATDLAFDE